MIVVSDDEDESDSSPQKFLSQNVTDSVLNINHDYRYLKMGYYVSAHAEIYGVKVTPSCTEIMDAYRNPLLISKANLNGIRTSKSSLTTLPHSNSCPSLLFAVSPFTYNSMKVVNTDSKLIEMVKKMSMGGRFPVSIHQLTGKVVEVVQVFGESNNKDLLNFTKKFYEVFNIPICKLVVQIDDNGIALCHCEPALKKEVDWDIVQKNIKRIRANGNI